MVGFSCIELPANVGARFTLVGNRSSVPTCKSPGIAIVPLETSKPSEDRVCLLIDLPGINESAAERARLQQRIAGCLSGICILVPIDNGLDGHTISALSMLSKSLEPSTPKMFLFTKPDSRFETSSLQIVDSMTHQNQVVNLAVTYGSKSEKKTQDGDDLLTSKFFLSFTTETDSVELQQDVTKENAERIWAYVTECNSEGPGIPALAIVYYPGQGMAKMVFLRDNIKPLFLKSTISSTPNSLIWIRLTSKFALQEAQQNVGDSLNLSQKRAVLDTLRVDLEGALRSEDVLAGFDDTMVDNMSKDEWTTTRVRAEGIINAALQSLTTGGSAWLLEHLQSTTCFCNRDKEPCFSISNDKKNTLIMFQREKWVGEDAEKLLELGDVVDSVEQPAEDTVDSRGRYRQALGFLREDATKLRDQLRRHPDLQHAFGNMPATHFQLFVPSADLGGFLDAFGPLKQSVGFRQVGKIHLMIHRNQKGLSTNTPVEPCLAQRT